MPRRGDRAVGEFGVMTIFKGARYHKGSANSRSRRKSPHNQGRKPRYKDTAVAAAHGQVCDTCDTYKSLTDFYRTFTSPYNRNEWCYRSTCKSCCRENSIRVKKQAKITKASLYYRLVDAYRNELAAPHVVHQLEDLLARPDRWESKCNWSEQDKGDLRILAEASVPPEQAARVLGRSPKALIWKARDIGISLPTGWRSLVTPKRLYVPHSARVQLFYPYIQRERPSDNDLLRVNDLVPRAFPEHMRADICQNIMLALFEGEVTLAEIEANQSQLTWFAKRWRGEQRPYQEVQVGGEDDERSYDEIAASVRSEGRRAALNELRHTWSAWEPVAEATQIDDVYHRELAAAHLHEYAKGNTVERSEIPALLEERGDSGARHLRDHFGSNEGIKVPLHARQRAMERYGLELDRRRSRALLQYCASRHPEEFAGGNAEVHIVRGGSSPMPVVYFRDESRIATILPPEWLEERGKTELLR